MKRNIVIFFFLTICSIIVFSVYQKQKNLFSEINLIEPKKEGTIVKKNDAGIQTTASIITIYNHDNYQKGFKKDNGFSCLIKTNNQKLLFDSGEISSILFDNLKKTKISPEEINQVFISSNHKQQIGALGDFLAVSSNPQVFAPPSLGISLKKQISSNTDSLIEIKEPQQLFQGIYSSGPLGLFKKEQSLLINTPQGLVIVAGNSFPGITAIAEKAKSLTNQKIHLIVGQFNLQNQPSFKIKIIASKLKK